MGAHDREPDRFDRRARSATAVRLSTMSGASATVARRVWLPLLMVAGIGAALYIGLPQIAGLDETWGRLSDGDPPVADCGAWL
jgi:hypothetical protein